MKIPEEQKTEIMEGLLELLDPNAVEVVEEIRNIPGIDLINLHGLTRTQGGALILPGILYSVSTTETRKIDHRQKIGQIIADAANMQEVHDRLGEYLFKYAADPARVVQSIPVHLSLKNIRQNGN